MTLLDAAVQYAHDGVAVFPCDDSKAPHILRGFHAASTSIHEVATWWQKWPDALIGAPVASDTVVLDMDPRNGGRETLRALLTQNGRDGFDRTTKARTRGGGLHYYFTFVLPEGRRFLKTAGPGIDVRAPGKAYVIVPPSPGYEWVQYDLALPLPGWVEPLITAADYESESVESDGLDDITPRYFPFEDGSAYGLRALEEETARLRLAEVGGRNHTLNEVAFSLAQLVAGGELEGEFTLAEIAQAAHDIGLDSHEIGVTLRSGWRAGIQRPRCAP